MKTLVGFNTRCFSAQHFPENVIKNYESSLASLLLWLSVHYGARFLFFSFYEESHQKDSRSYRNLLLRLSDPKILLETFRYRNLSDLRSGLGRCHFFIGTRFHSVLLAVQAGVPVLGLSYAEKTYRFMEQTGLEDYVIRIESLSFEVLKGVWEKLWLNRELLQRKLYFVKQQQKELAMKHFDLIFQVLER